MKHVLEARRGKRVILSLLATTCLVIGPPTAVASAKGGAQKPVSSTHGDCKNNNRGKHKGYVCPGNNGGGATGVDNGGGSTGGGTTDYNSGGDQPVIIIS
jgi:uncharacterized membrane protein YgcG